MRRSTAFFTLVCLVAIGLASQGQGSLALEELHLVSVEDVPNGRHAYDAPVSSAILMAWHAEHGYPALLPDLNGDGRVDEQDTILLATEFADPMGADYRIGVLDPWLVDVLAPYVAERYPDEFRMLIYDPSFPEEYRDHLGMPFDPNRYAGIEVEILEEPSHEAYTLHLEERRPGIVGFGFEPEENRFSVSRSFELHEEPQGWPVDLVNAAREAFGPDPVWNTFLRWDPERWGFLTPDWTPFEIFIVLVPRHEVGGDPGQPGDPGDDPSGDPGGDPREPGGDPGDDSGACCLPDGTCASLSPAACAQQSGAFIGYKISCLGISCEPRKPAGGTPTPGDPSQEVADLQVTMNLVAPSSEPVADDSSPQYNLIVWHNGTDTARNVVLRITMPSEVTTLNAGGTPIYLAKRPPNDVIEWHLGDLPTFPQGTGVWLQVDVDPGFCGAIQFQFDVSSDTYDPDLSNNSGTLATQVGPCGGEPGAPPGGRDEGEPGEPSGGRDDGLTGACCLPDGSCDSVDEAECLRRQGLFYGPTTDCAGIRCFPPEPPPCPIVYSRVLNACQLYQGPDQPMIVKADFELRNPGNKDAVSVGVRLVAGVPLLSNLVTTYTSIYEFVIPMIPAGGSHQFSHTFSISPAPPQQPTGQTVVMMFAVPITPLCKPNIQSAMQLFHLLYFGPNERLCPEDGDSPPGGEGDVAGACCLPGGSCEGLTAAECDRQGGQFFGSGTSCEGVECDGEAEPEPEPEPDPGSDPVPTALPNLWVTNMSGCWSWSTDGQEHVIATVRGTVHNGGQAAASNVKAQVTAYGQSKTVTVGSISAGGQRTVTATIDIGAYDSVSWPVSTSITADPTHVITEADESNNTTNSSFPQSSDCN